MRTNQLKSEIGLSGGIESEVWAIIAIDCLISDFWKKKLKKLCVSIGRETGASTKASNDTNAAFPGQSRLKVSGAKLAV
jgi:hypothetical protein